MARMARVVLPGCPHHVAKRGNRRQRTFFCEADYQAYIDLLAEACRMHNTEVNPVKAKLVTHPQDWPWSSARARSGNTADKLTQLEPLKRMVQDWPAFWSQEGGDRVNDIRRHTQTGRPLGSNSFIAKTERRLGRALRR